MPQSRTNLHTPPEPAAGATACRGWGGQGNHTGNSGSNLFCDSGKERWAEVLPEQDSGVLAWAAGHPTEQLFGAAVEMHWVEKGNRQTCRAWGHQVVPGLVPSDPIHSGHTTGAVGGHKLPSCLAFALPGGRHERQAQVIWSMWGGSSSLQTIAEAGQAVHP